MLSLQEGQATSVSYQPQFHGAQAKFQASVAMSLEAPFLQIIPTRPGAAVWWGRDTGASITLAAAHHGWKVYAGRYKPRRTGYTLPSVLLLKQGCHSDRNSVSAPQGQILAGRGSCKGVWKCTKKKLALLSTPRVWVNSSLRLPWKKKMEILVLSN